MFISIGRYTHWQGDRSRKILDISIKNCNFAVRLCPKFIYSLVKAEHLAVFKPVPMNF